MNTPACFRKLQTKKFLEEKSKRRKFFLQSFLLICDTNFLMIANIDSTAFVLCLPMQIPELLERLEDVLSHLKQKLVPTAKKRRTGFFKSSQAISELLHSNELKEEDISNVVNFERRLFNFLFQWVSIIVQLSDGKLHESELSPILEFVTCQCGFDKQKIILNYINDSHTSKSIPRSISFDTMIENEFVPPGER